MSSKLAGLASSLATAHQSVETEAQRALDRLNAARDKAVAGIGKIDNVSAAIEKSTADIENFANQITNGGPPL